MQQYILILESSVFAALLSLLIEFCLRDGMILGFYLNRISDWWLIKNDPQSYEDGNALRSLTSVECEQMTGYESEYEFKRAKVRWFLFKPLGYCVVCFNVWLTLPFALFMPTFYGFIFTLLLSNFIVRYFYEKIV